MKKIILILALLLMMTGCAEGVTDYLDDSRCPFWYFGGPTGAPAVYDSVETRESQLEHWDEWYGQLYSPERDSELLFWNMNAPWADFPRDEFPLVETSVIRCDDLFTKPYRVEYLELGKEYILELYSVGADYLVIARDDVDIVCMQYVNSADSHAYFDREYQDISDIGNDIYAHYFWSLADQQYTAFFLDGTCVNILFSATDDSYIQKEHNTHSGILIKYFDICTYDENFEWEFSGGGPKE